MESEMMDKGRLLYEVLREIEQPKMWGDVDWSEESNMSKLFLGFSET